MEVVEAIPGPTVRVVGYLESPRPRCEMARRVTAVDYSIFGQPPTFVGADLSSLRGGFRVEGERSESNRGHILVTAHRQNTGRNGHRHICESDSYLIDTLP